MTSSWRHNTKFWGQFLHFWTVQTNIYQIIACNNHHLKRFSSYIKLERSRFTVFRSSRERVGYRNMPCTFVIVPWLKVRREGAIFMKHLWRVVCYCWMMFQVDKCLNEDPGPLPGPRAINSDFIVIGSTVVLELLLQLLQYVQLIICEQVI